MHNTAFNMTACDTLERSLPLCAKLWPCVYT
jgi:hypothetical protein